NEGEASAVPITPAAAVSMTGANTGNANLVGSVRRRDGRFNELVIAETLEIRCTSDDQTSASGRAEQWQVLGEVPLGEVTDFRWPDGSGATATLTTVDASGANASGNPPTHSDREDPTSN